MEAEALNIPAIIAGVVAGFVLGAIIYNPRVLGTVWAEGSGIDLDGHNGPPMMAFVLQILALLCLALVVGITASVSFLGAALLAIAAAALFVVSGDVFIRKSKGATMIDGAYIVGAGALMIVAQGLL